MTIAEQIVEAEKKAQEALDAYLLAQQMRDPLLKK
jgi:hypothetical protein